MKVHLSGSLAPTVTGFTDMGKDKDMDMDGYGWRWFEVLSSIASILGGLVMFAIVAAVVYFLLRFLIIGTRAAQLYIDQNATTPPARPGAPDPYFPRPGPTGPSSTDPGPIGPDSTGPDSTGLNSTGPDSTGPAAQDLGATRPSSTGAEADPVRTMKLPTSSDAVTVPLTPPGFVRAPRATRTPRTPKPSE